MGVLMVNNSVWYELIGGVIVPGLLAMIVWGGIVYLVATQQQVPDVLAAAGGTVLGFYFRAQVQRAVDKGST